MRSLRLQLNTFLSGPQAWLFLAEARGYLSEAGVAIDWVPGDTAANVVPRMVADATLDVGYGDLNALVSHVAQHGVSDDAPVAVFNAYNASPYTIAVPAHSTRRAPRDLEGARILTHPQDAAMLLFPEFCAATGLEATSIEVADDPVPHSVLVPQLLAGRDAKGHAFHALFGFVNTLAAACVDAGLDPAVLRHLDYRTYVPDLYGMALMVRRPLLAAEPDLVRRLLAALNQGLQDTAAAPEAAITAVDAYIRTHRVASEHWTPRNREANLQRLTRTLAWEFAHPEGTRLGIGDLDDARLARSAALMARVRGWPRAPAAADLFLRDCLPPLHQRLTGLAKS